MEIYTEVCGGLHEGLCRGLHRGLHGGLRRFVIPSDLIGCGGDH